MPRPRRGLSIVIPAAGMGRRMRSYGPKPLISISTDETVVSRQVRILGSAFPRAEIVVVVGHESDRIMRALPPGLRVVENEMYETTNVVRSVGMGLRVASHDRVLVVYGDLVFNPAAVEWARDASVSSVLVDGRRQMEDTEVGVNVVSGRVSSFSYGLPVKWCHVAYLAGRELQLFRSLAWDPSLRRHFGFEALNEVINAGGRLRAVEPPEMKIAEIDSPSDIDRARLVARELGEVLCRENPLPAVRRGQRVIA